MRQAFVVLAHSRLDLLENLFRALKSEDFDIYLHMDASAPFTAQQLHNLASKFKNVELLSRNSSYWGDISLVDTELACFKEVLSKGLEYSHIHLLSGQCFPIKSNSEIRDFFTSHQGEEFLEMAPEETIHYDHVRCWIPWPYYFKYKKGSRLNYRIHKLTNQLIYALQKGILRWHKNPSRDKTQYRKCPQWVSITPAFAAHLVDQKEKFHELYEHSLAPDEFFVATEAWNSSFRGAINATPTRYILWASDHTPHPLPIGPDELKGAIASPCFFTRKVEDATLTL